VSAHGAPGDVNAIFTKALIPFLEREAGRDAVRGVLEITDRPRAWLTAEYNWLPLEQADALVRHAMKATGEPDEDRWARRFAESFMDWKPTREERAYIGTYTMALGSPHAVYERLPVIYGMLSRLCEPVMVELRRRRATLRLTPRAGLTLPRWACTWLRVMVERFPTNWNLPRARVVERQCAAAGAPSCLWEIHWTNPPWGFRFWTPTLVGAATSVASVTVSPAVPLGAAVALTLLPAVCGAALGIAWLKDHRHLSVQRLRDLEGEEVLHSNRELEEKFRTIDELTRGLEEKVRQRTEELASAYQELQRTQMQLVQREKMASVGQLVAGVAHELNNPIGFVFSNIVTLEDYVRRLRAMLDTYRALALPAAERAGVEARWDELKVEYALRYVDAMIQGIREGAERSRKIVGDLRVFARTRDDVWQALDLHEELESSLTLLGHLLGDRVTVERRFGDVPPVECIRSEMDQVFLNLLANAAQAIEGRGAITIVTRAEDGMAVVKITDTGPGVPADLLDRVFDPIFTTKPVGEGTGLGLSISYEIVKKHGGTITGSSPPGGGARFTVSIPLARGAGG
jgi:two-component system NtrC family sensor kinase